MGIFESRTISAPYPLRTVGPRDESQLAQDEAQISELIAACKAGRLYAAEAWIASGQPIQVDPAKIIRG